jgi:hypothetical protein
LKKASFAESFFVSRRMTFSAKRAQQALKLSMPAF